MHGNLEHVTASSSDLARLLNLSTRRVQQLVKAGLLPTPGPQGHRIVEAVRAYLRVLQQPTRTANLSEARQKLIEVQTQIRQVELEEKHGSLVSRSAVEGEFFTLARTIRDNFKNFPARCSGLVASEGDQEGCHAILAGEVRQVLEGFAQRSGNGNGTMRCLITALLLLLVSTTTEYRLQLN